MPFFALIVRLMAGTSCVCSALKLCAEKLISTVSVDEAFKLKRTKAFFSARLGYTCISSKQVLGTLCSSMRPTIPFQLPCVWSVILCESGPTLISLMRLSTRILIRHSLPGVTAAVRS